VPRYAHSAAIAMWEPMNEGEASTCAAGFSAADCYGHLTCPDEAGAAAALRSFYDTIGAAIHTLDRNHLVQSGALGGPQCGWVDGNFSLVSASPGIDVTSFHDYSQSPSVTPLLADRIDQSAALGKPLFVGEAGVEAGTGPSCPSVTDRAATIGSMTSAMRARGVAAIALWNFEPTPIAGCTWALLAGDPALASLRGA
jgi:hypothetical protein